MRITVSMWLMKNLAICRSHRGGRLPEMALTTVSKRGRHQRQRVKFLVFLQKIQPVNSDPRLTLNPVPFCLPNPRTR